MPKRIEEFVKAYVSVFHAPADHYGLSLLTAAGAALGNSVRIDDRGTLHPPVLYSCLVDVPGSGKTPTLDTVFRPFTVLEEEARKEHARAEAEAKAMGDEEPIPHPAETMVVDFTLESLVDVLERNPRGVIAISDEIEGFLTGMDKYRNGKGGDGPFWLSGYTGQPYKANRRNRGGKPAYIPRVFCPFIGGIQPGLLTSFADDSRDSSGFLARVLFTIPPLAKKQHYHNDRPDRGHTEHWEKVIRRLREITPQEVEVDEAGRSYTRPHIVKMSSDAKKIYAGFVNGLADRINDLEERDLVERSTLVKFETHTLRFALILHFLDWANANPITAAQQPSDAWLSAGYISATDIPNEEISASVMTRALEISKYFMATGLEVVGRLESYVKSLTPRAQAWYEALPEEGTRKAAIEIGKEAGFSQKSVDRYLKDPKLFKKTRGRFEKIL